MSDLATLDLSYYGSTREEIEDCLIFPVGLIFKYTHRFFLKAWAFLHGVGTISRRELNELSKHGIFVKYNLSVEEVVAILKEKEGQRIHHSSSLSIDICDWCHAEAYALHNHHHPIPKKSGGTAVVQICANCHYEFHILSDSVQYRPSQEIQEALACSKKRKQEILEEFDRRMGGAQ